MSRVMINGQETDRLSVRDRGLQYGDGLFETLAVCREVPLLWPEHLERLLRSCDRLGIARPDPALLRDEAWQLCRGQERAVLKLIITRGEGGRGYRPPEAAEPTRILSLHPWPDYPLDRVEQGIRIRSCDTRLARQPVLAGIKHLNRLEQVLARREWNDPDIVEGVMRDMDGLVIEATMGNLFFVQEDNLLTPDLAQCGVDGVMRRQILAVCEELSIPVRIADLGLEEARASREVLVTNSLIGVWPVRQWDDTKYPVQGRWTETIINALKEQLAVCE